MAELTEQECLTAIRFLGGESIPQGVAAGLLGKILGDHPQVKEYRERQRRRDMPSAPGWFWLQAEGWPEPGVVSVREQNGRMEYHSGGVWRDVAGIGLAGKWLGRVAAPALTVVKETPNGDATAAGSGGSGDAGGGGIRPAGQGGDPGGCPGTAGRG